jgi:phosphoglycerate dehydrogenase-like enzyme
MRSLELIQIASAGYSQLIHLGLGGKGIRACNALGNFDVPIAEWNLAMMVNLARNLRGMIRNQESGVWNRSAVFQKEIRGSVLGIWGYGGIGRETRLAKALGLQVHVMTRAGVTRLMLTNSRALAMRKAFCLTRIFQTGQGEFLSGWTAWCCHAAHQTNEGVSENCAPASDSFPAEPGRGPLVQGRRLTALREGWIARAALDTHYAYHHSAHPLWRF